ncbi:Peptidyl-prolyl cis-trans isomerase FKBP13, chloroplastic, partial [Linum grandiflorum]
GPARSSAIKIVEREFSPSYLFSNSNLYLAAMNSLPFSVGRYCYTPRRKLSTKTMVKKSETTEYSSSTVKYSAYQKKGLSLLGRRETLGLGFCATLLDVVVFQQKSTAEAAETAPCELNLTPSGLSFCDKVVGSGPEAVKGQLIKTHYVGKLENGQVFDSSYNRGKPLTFRVGVGEVIQGWDKGIIGGDGIPSMQAGGKRVLKIPPELGYGVRGAGCRGGSCIIPPNSVLVFDVEFIGKA